MSAEPGKRIRNNVGLPALGERGLRNRVKHINDAAERGLKEFHIEQVIGDIVAVAMPERFSALPPVFGTEAYKQSVSPKDWSLLLGILSGGAICSPRPDCVLT